VDFCLLLVLTFPKRLRFLLSLNFSRLDGGRPLQERGFIFWWFKPSFLPVSHCTQANAFPRAFFENGFSTREDSSSCFPGDLWIDRIGSHSPLHSFFLFNNSASINNYALTMVPFFFNVQWNPRTRFSSSSFSPSCRTSSCNVPKLLPCSL